MYVPSCRGQTSGAGGGGGGFSSMDELDREKWEEPPAGDFADS